jgi:hypothetical protein
MWKEDCMNLIRRIAIAIGTLTALVLAGGAHYKLH